MSRDTEKILKELQKFVGDKDLNSEEELNHVVSDFMEMQNKKTQKKAKDAWDYMDMAYEADDEKEALKYAKKALQLDKDFLDAEVMIADLTADDDEDLQSKYEELIKKTETRFKEENVLSDENIGHFWGILETRPYMRLRGTYLNHLIHMGKFRKAIYECENLLVLSEGDNLGIRYTLISLYALYEDELNVLKLYKKYKEDNALMLLPIIAMYYKMDNYKKAETYLKKLNAANADFAELFCNPEAFNEDEMEDVIESGMYRADSIEEIMIAISDSPFLYGTAPSLLLWMAKRLSKMKR